MKLQLRQIRIGLWLHTVHKAVVQMIINGNELIADNGKIIVKDGVIIGNKLSLGCQDSAEYYVEVDYEEIQKEETELI